MEPTYDSRGSENAAMEKTAAPGGNGTNGSAAGGTPRSWRQYIEQNLPAQAAAPTAQESTGAGQARPDRKARTRSSWERRVRRSARRARECGKKTRSAAAGFREKLAHAVSLCRKKLSGAAAVCREKLGPAVTVCREKLGRAAAVCREKLGPVVTVCREKLAHVAAFCRKKLGPVAAVCREKLEPVATAVRKKLGPGAEKIRTAVARHPISPLLYVTLLAVFLGVAAFQGNYARAYVLEVNGQKVGLVSDENEASAILSNVENRAASLLGTDFDYEVSVTLSPVYAAPGDLTDAAEMEDVLFEEMGAAYMSLWAASGGEDAVVEEVVPTAWAISVDGVELGIADDKGVFYRMLDAIAQPYLPANTVRYEFVEDVRVYPVDFPADGNFDDLEPIREELSALRVEEAVYTVKKGDTFNAIAYSLDMMPYQLAALNPNIKVDLLSIGQKLVIQQAVPRLSVLAFTDETYEQAIPSPVEYIETADLYVGDTKVKTQGTDGLALVNAKVAYLNNSEVGREILESTTLEEATTTYTYTGTTPRPRTASNGYFIWPVKGPITSNFGYRYLWGRYDYHLGIDIGVPSGTSVKAADGGTVIKSGWEGSYGYLVAIRHDNGMVTYYAHNSSLLVKVGEKVYQGQIIAKSGATGNVTGPHCHFEIRVNGSPVNPRPYLS